MSDYMFMLESHLTGAQRRVVDQMQAAATELGTSLYLTGGAMRDMLAGFAVRDLEFVTEGSPLKLVRTVSKKFGVKAKSTDERRKSAALQFPNGVQAELAMAVEVKFSKSGGRPKVTTATIHEDLESRDFTLNAVALSLNHASLGLIIDPTNGVGDIERRELRTIQNYSFYDVPSRIIRLIRYKGRLGFEVEERTGLQYQNAIEAGMLKKIPAADLGTELRGVAGEINAQGVVQALEEAGMWALYSEALSGAKLNLATFAKLQKANQMIPVDCDFPYDPTPLFLHVLLEKLTPKERAEVIKAARLSRTEAGAPQKMVTAARKLERSLKGAKLAKPSALYQVLSAAPGEQILYLAVYSGQRIVQDRIKNYFNKYLPAASEVTDEVVAEEGHTPGTPKFRKAKQEMIHTRLDSRPKKAPAAPPPPPPPPASGFQRGARRAQG